MSLYECKACDSPPCNEGTCCNGRGTVRVFDTEDGPNTYSCQCYRAKATRRRQDEDREIRAFIRKYGRDRVSVVLAAGEAL